MLTSGARSACSCVKYPVTMWSRQTRSAMDMCIANLQTSPLPPNLKYSSDGRVMMQLPESSVMKPLTHQPWPVQIIGKEFYYRDDATCRAPKPPGPPGSPAYLPPPKNLPPRAPVYRCAYYKLSSLVA